MRCPSSLLLIQWCLTVSRLRRIRSMGGLRRFKTRRSTRRYEGMPLILRGYMLPAQLVSVVPPSCQYVRAKGAGPDRYLSPSHNVEPLLRLSSPSQGFLSLSRTSQRYHRHAASVTLRHCFVSGQSDSYLGRLRLHLRLRPRSLATFNPTILYRRRSTLTSLPPPLLRITSHPALSRGRRHQ